MFLSESMDYMAYYSYKNQQFHSQQVQVSNSNKIRSQPITESAVLISLFSLILLTQQTIPKYTDLVITDWYKTSPHFPAQCALIYLSPSFIQPLCSSLFTFHFGLLLMWTPRHQYSYIKSKVCPRIWHYKSRDDKWQIVFVLSCKILYLCCKGGHF